MADPRFPRIWRRRLRIAPRSVCPSGETPPRSNSWSFSTTRGEAGRPDEVRLIERFGHRASVAQTNAKFHQQAEVSAALEERQRIAANMHDGLAQVLSYMNLKTDIALACLENQKSQQALEELLLVQSLSTASVEECVAPSPACSRTRNRAVVAGDAQAHRGRVRLDDEPPVRSRSGSSTPLPAPRRVGAGAARGAGSDLNARRHAQGSRLTVTVARCQGDLHSGRRGRRMRFRPQALPEHGGHFGLSIMQARATQSTAL